MKVICWSQLESLVLHSDPENKHMYIYLYLKIQTMNHPTFTNGHFAKILLVVMK